MRDNRQSAEQYRDWLIDCLHRYGHDELIAVICPYGEDEMVNEMLEPLKEQGAEHGEWITIWREDDPDTSTHARCSVCNRVSKRPAGKYCKWCGARMDLEGGEVE